jgi:hypothetical protein
MILGLKKMPPELGRVAETGGRTPVRTRLATPIQSISPASGGQPIGIPDIPASPWGWFWDGDNTGQMYQRCPGLTEIKGSIPGLVIHPYIRMNDWKIDKGRISFRHVQCF